MARQARIKQEFGVFYICQEGSCHRHLFQNNLDKDKFLEILRKTEARFKYRLLAYCMAEPNRYELVIDTNGSDLSKIMKSINISYAMYVKCPEKLFKDRYKSHLLKEDEDLMDFFKSNDLQSHLKTLGTNEADELETSSFFSNYTYCQLIYEPSSDCQNCIKTLSEAKARIQEIAQLKKIAIEDLFSDKDDRNRLIQDIRQQSTLSLKEIGQLFGGLSESSICKILNLNCK